MKASKLLGYATFYFFTERNNQNEGWDDAFYSAVSLLLYSIFVDAYNRPRFGHYFVPLERL